jgi:hypothetical protein
VDKYTGSLRKKDNIHLFTKVIKKAIFYTLSHVLNYREEIEKAQKA